MAKEKNTSFLLGKFVYLLQAMEETMPNQEKKGADWGEQVLLLSMANLHSTLQMMEKVLSNVPDSATIPSGQTITRQDMHNLIDEMDLSIFRAESLDKDLFLQGYQNPFSSLSENPSYTRNSNSNSQENRDNSRSQSHHLGCFMGILSCLEKSLLEQSIEPDRNYAEDAYLLFSINFQTAMQMAQKSIGALPQSEEVFSGGVSLSGLKSAFSLLNLDVLSNETIKKTDFIQGFQQIMSEYLA